MLVGGDGEDPERFPSEMLLVLFCGMSWRRAQAM